MDLPPFVYPFVFPEFDVAIADGSSPSVEVEETFDKLAVEDKFNDQEFDAQEPDTEVDVDEAFLNFQKAVTLVPDQVLRYFS